jgi:hypothetical protein
VHQNSAIPRTDDGDVLTTVHGDLGQSDVPGLVERRVQQGIGFLASRVGSDIVGGLEVDWIDFAQVNELKNLNVASAYGIGSI